MIINGKDLSTPQSAQICVIGSGPAGITAAWELSQAGYDVILLEGSRELDYDLPDYYKRSWPDKAKLYKGVADGLFTANEPEFLILPQSTGDKAWERERVYGGTSTHWGGQSRPLDPVAFEKRPGFPGWPITRQDLDPYYAKACTLNHLYGNYNASGDNFTAEFWADTINTQQGQGTASVPILSGFNTEMYQFMGSQWLNFATRTFTSSSGGSTTIGDKVRVIVNASVLGIIEQGGSIQYVNAASMDDDQGNPQKATEFTVTADIYILACGSVANAQQLLMRR